MNGVNENLAYLLYFIAGAGGTAGRVALSTVMVLGVNNRSIVEIISGGVGGIVLAYFGTPLAVAIGLPPEAVKGVPAIIRACLVFLAAGAVSLGTGEVLARLKGGGA